MNAALTFAMVSLHFPGMKVFSVSPLDVSGDFINSEAFKVLALAISGTAIVIVIGAQFNYMVENRTWMENINELRTPLTIVLC
jgi:NO-binding membrane sensor protein with MHYT domain